MRVMQVSKGYFLAAIIMIALLGVLGNIFGCKPLPNDGENEKTFIYTAKFVCAPEVGPAEFEQVEIPFVPAFYRTVINVHNFSGDTVQFTKKAVLARSQDIDRGVISQKVTETLMPDEALAIDCLDIFNLFGGPQPIGDGFVVIESTSELDVAAVYTALLKETLQGVSIDVEYIQPKVVRNAQPIGNPDLLPVRRPGGQGSEGFCNRDDQGRLVIVVRNQGSVDSNACTTRVRFFTSAGEVDVDLPTPVVPAGTSVELTPHIEFPSGCFISDCNFKIIVDVNNNVNESNEANNVADGKCIG